MWITVLGVLSLSMFHPTQRACFLVKGILRPVFISWRGTCKRGRHNSLREMWRSFIQEMYWCGLGIVTLMCSLLWCYLIIRDVVLLQHVFYFFFHYLCLPWDFETNFDVRKVLHHWKELGIHVLGCNIHFNEVHGPSFKI
jgi:hypothetical protein